MRGSFFAKPLEIIIEIDGERWKQGETVRGRLALRNRGSTPFSAGGFDVQLCRAQLSAVKKKSETAFKLLQKHEISGEIAAGGELSSEFHFDLGLNAPVTDSVSSAFITCGPGALQLQIEPSLVIQEFTSTLQAQHHFGFKGYKQSKAGVGARFSAPDGQRFSALEDLVLTLQFTEESGHPDLEVEYDFQVKQVGSGPLPTKTTMVSRKVEQVLTSVDYLTSSGRVNFDVIQKFVAEAVSTVESKILF
jgi:hypothetical protein